MAKARCTVSFDRVRRRYAYTVWAPVFYEGHLVPDPRLPTDGLRGIGLGPDEVRRWEAELAGVKAATSDQLQIPAAEISCVVP